MSVVKFLKELGLHKDPDVQKRLAEIEASKKILEDKKTKISPKKMDQFVNEKNEELQRLAMKRSELTDKHLDQLLVNHPDTYEVLEHPKLSSQSLERFVNQQIGSKGFESNVDEDDSRYHKVRTALEHPNSTANMARAVLPKNEGELMPHEMIHALTNRKSTPSDVLHRLVTMQPHEIGTFNRQGLLEPGSADLWKRDKDTTEGWYENLVLHPNTSGKTLEEITKNLKDRTHPYGRNRFHVPLAMHPNSTDTVLHYVASHPNHKGEPIIGLYNDRDFANKELLSKSSHTMVAKHRNASDATLAKLLSHKINKYDRERGLQTLKAISVHPNAKPKTVAGAKAQIAEIRKVYNPL